MLEALLATSQLAERWGCSPGHLKNLRCAGRGPAYVRLGSNVRYRMSDVLAFEAANLVGAAA